MNFKWAAAAILTAGLINAQTNAELKEQVRQTEIAFAKTMTDRDLNAFQKFLSKETIFIANGKPTRGPAAVTAQWRPLFAGPKARFSWTPETVEVLGSGKLALSSGPVRDPEGKRVGTYNSIWRREGSNWRIILDSGCPTCDCGK